MIWRRLVVWDVAEEFRIVGSLVSFRNVLGSRSFVGGGETLPTFEVFWACNLVVLCRPSRAVEYHSPP